MLIEGARKYIKKKIEQTAGKDSHRYVEIYSEVSQKSAATLAQEEAAQGLPSSTASFLQSDTSLPLSRKGETLAEALNNAADRTTFLREQFPRDRFPYINAGWKREARQERDAAERLTRAARKLGNN